MGLLVSIDNGGTLTDICATDGDTLVHAKTLTTPHDLTECFIAGLEALSEKLFGAVDLPRLVSRIDHIRYSTTQGTNAIVQRKGPLLGLLTTAKSTGAEARKLSPELFDSFVGSRVRVVAAQDLDTTTLARAVAELVSAGASRVVVAGSGPEAGAWEREAKRVLYRAFPRHLLGAAPLLFSSELSRIGGEGRRVWTALINAFLHPAMERFLYNAENRLRRHRIRNPLLVFQNDGSSTRVARSVAVKTYSSGPRGGVEGGRVLCRHYGLDRAVSIDIGGTTTDIALFAGGEVAEHRMAEIEGVPVSIALAEVESIGAGGGSIFRVVDGAVTVGPDSVGSSPGPACFGRGGTNATITDAYLAIGLLDPASYFGGRLVLDEARARNAILAEIAGPLGVDLETAVAAMVEAYELRIAQALSAAERLGPDAALMAFGGAGPMSACGIAERAGLRRVLVPRYAAVFSAFGIGFSDIEHEHVAPCPADVDAGAVREDLMGRGRRAMLAEGFDPDGCTTEFAELRETPDGMEPWGADGGDGGEGARWLQLRMRREIPHFRMAPVEPVTPAAAKPAGRRGPKDLAVYRLEDLAPGDGAAGPCLLEEAYFTTWVKPGWRFAITSPGDVFLTREN